MTKTEIIYVVMGHAGVRKADIVESVEPGSVTIRVAVDPGYDNDDIYEIRNNIIMSLEPRRPAGVGFEVVVKRDGEVSVPSMGRFAAVAAELTAHIAPVKKPPPPMVEKPRATVLFEVIIEVASGQPSPCPRCSCQAFTLDENGKQAACRGCPLPSPLYSVEYKDSARLVSRDYKCCQCGSKSMVTMQLNEINLYCWGCQRLCLHSMQWEEKKLPVPVVVPIEDPSRDPERASRIIRGSKAVFKFNNIEVGTVTDVEYVESEFDSDSYKDVPSGEGYSISMTLEARSEQDWVQTIEKLQQKVAGTYGMSIEQLTASPAVGLMEMFREKLGLLPFAMFEQQQRNENIMREGKDLPPDGRYRDRRTGRTTRGLLQAIAQYVVSDLRFLCVIGVSERYTRDLWRLAEEMVRNINLASRVDIKPIMPNDFDPQYDYTRGQRAFVYVDHSWEERAQRR